MSTISEGRSIVTVDQPIEAYRAKVQLGQIIAGTQPRRYTSSAIGVHKSTPALLGGVDKILRCLSRSELRRSCRLALQPDQLRLI